VGPYAVGAINKRTRSVFARVSFRAKLILALRPFFTVGLLCLLATGVYSYFAPFWALPSEFLTGYSAAAGIALINSVGALGRLRGAVYDRSDRYQSWQSLHGPCHCWRPIVHISDSRVATAKEGWKLARLANSRNSGVNRPYGNYFRLARHTSGYGPKVTDESPPKV